MAAKLPLHKPDKASRSAGRRPGSGLVRRFAPAPLARDLWAAAHSNAEREAARAAAGAAVSFRAAPPAWTGAVPQPPATSPGRPLPERPRQELEARYQADLGHVAIHADAAAARFAAGLGARAVAMGGDVYFGANQFRPQSAAGVRLLAHEVAHTLQPAGSTPQLDLTPEQRRELQRLIEASTTAQFEALQAEVAPLPGRTALEGEDHERYRAMESAITQGLERLARSSASDREMRERHLQLVRRALRGSKLFLYRALRSTDDVAGVLRDIGNPDHEYDAEVLQHEVNLLGQGGDAFVRYVIQSSVTDMVLALHGVSREEYFSEEEEGEPGAGPGTEPPADGEPGGAPPPPTDEHHAEAEALVQRIADRAGSDRGEPVDMDRLAELIADMSPEELAEFEELFGQQVAEEGEEGHSLIELIEAYQAMDESQREVYRANLELTEGLEGEPTPLNEVEFLRIQNSAAATERLEEGVAQVNSVLDQIRSRVADPERASELASLGELSPFFNEMMMLEGLLAGAGSQSDEIREISVDLLNNMEAARAQLMEEIAWLIGELVAVEVVAYLLAPATAGGSAVVGAGRALVMLERLNRLRLRLQTLMRVYETYQQIRRIIDRVREAGEAYERFRQNYEGLLERYQALQRRLNEIDDQEAVEAEIEALEEQLYGEVEAQLGGQLGVLLETFYIPDDAGPEQLMQIVMNLPRGVEVMDSLLQYYQDNRERSDAQFTQVLAVRAFRAGALLYPVVGYIAAITSERLAELAEGHTIEERAQRFLERLGDRRSRDSSESRRRERDRNRGLLGRNRMDYDESDLRTMLGEAETWLRRNLNEDEPGGFTGGHWTYAWFRYTMRHKVRDLNRAFRSRRVRGRPRGTSESWTNVPLPPFRLDWPLDQRGSQLRVNLELNPERTLRVDELSYADFSGTGIRFSGGRSARRRREALENWLNEHDYTLGEDQQGEPFVRRDGAVTTEMLHLASNGYLKQDPDPQFTTNYRTRYIGKTVRDSDDLPEGYYKVDPGSTEDGGFVQRKRGFGRAGRNWPRLGLDRDGKLVEGAGERESRTVRPAGIIEPTAHESFDWRASLDNMFDATGGERPRMQTGGRTRDQWEDEIEGNPELQQRPTHVEGELGYLVNARSESDLLGSRRLPEMKTGDDRGHLVARRFHGSDDHDNLIPMKRLVNRYPGRWYRLEQEWANVFLGSDPAAVHYVHVDVEIEYPDRDTRRPSEFSGTWEERNATHARVGRPRRIAAINN